MEKFSNFDFARAATRQTEYCNLAHQAECAVMLEDLSSDAMYDDSTLRHKLGWMCLTRSDMYAVENMPLKVIESTFSKEHIRKLSVEVKMVKETKRNRLRFYTLDMRSLKIVAISDA